MSTSTPTSTPSSPKYVNPTHCILDSAILEFHTNTHKIPKELLCNMDITIDNHNPSTTTQPNDNESFGCLEIHTGETTINIDPVFFLFTIDESGSMSEICKDGKTKMDHVHFTMNQMLHYFAENPEATIYVHVNAFHDNVRTIIEKTQVTHKNVNNIIEQIKKIRPQNSTNFESALKSANEVINEHVQTTSNNNQSPERIVHVLLTDGNPTMGDCSESYLSSLVDDSFSNVFIAFGLDHNPTLMNKLGNAGKNTTNYLVKKLELIGHVYGEIVHNHLFNVLDSPVLEIEDGLIYDWYSNEWKTTLQISSLTSEAKKFYYIKSSNPDETRIRISGRPIDDFAGDYFEEYVDKLPDLFETRVVESPDTETTTSESIPEITTEEIIVDVDLTKHILRLCTQRLLYEARKYANKENIEEYDDLPLSQSIPFLNRSYNIDYNDDADDINNDITNNKPMLSPPKLERNKTKMYDLNLDDIPEQHPSSNISNLNLLKSRIKDHLNYMTNYLEQSDIKEKHKNQDKNQESQFIKTLCEDMNIALKTIGTRNQESYINARSLSQGRQQIYNVTMNDDLSELSEHLNNDINNAYATPSAIKIMRGFSER